MKVKKPFTIVDLNEDICLVTFKTQYMLAKTFLRFQEHYESPEFRGKIFTLGQYKAWHIEKYGQFDYYDIWEGFNIPLSVLVDFDKKFEPLSRDEQALWNVIKNKPRAKYIIGISEDNDDKECVLRHEIAHALYATNWFYKHRVLRCLKKNWIALLPLGLHILKLGYHCAVLLDEIQAYLNLDSADLLGISLKIDRQEKIDYIDQFALNHGSIVKAVADIYKETVDGYLR